MAVNTNIPLLTQVTNISGLADQFRDGQKLRQEYDARQHQKALNELMKVSDFNERLTLAQQHKYAGVLVPAVQEYEEARQKAALGNLKDSAEIQKTFAETGKFNADAGKVVAETEGESLKTAQGVSDYISAAAVTQDPTAFGVKIGELYKRGLITPEQTQSLLGMVQKDPQNAAKLMQRMAMGNPEIAKTFLPSMQKIELGDRVGLGTYDPLTGHYTGLGDYNIGQSPDNVLDNQTSRENNIRTNQTSRDNNYNSAQASMYGADRRYASSVYATDVASQDRQLKLNQDGQIEWFKAENKANTDAYNAQTNRQKALSPTANRKPKAAFVLKMENEYQQQLESNAHTMRQVADWMGKISKGGLELGAVNNARNSLANHTGISVLGNNPTEYAEFNAFVKDLATKALRLNKGVQTDSDYKRQLEALIAGDYIPRDKSTAIGLLSRIQKDFEAANKGIYSSLKNVKEEYGQKMPTYGAGAKSNGQAQTAPAMPKIHALGDSIFK